MSKIVFITGFMTSGKSTVGRQLARLIGWHFVDLDREIEKKLGLKVSTIFRIKGEPFFRRMETELLSAFSRKPNQVIALGGGALILARNRVLVRKRGILVHLKVQPSTVLARLRKDGNTRPLLASMNRREALGRIAELVGARKPGYDEAKIRISTDQRSPEELAKMIMNSLRDLINFTPDKKQSSRPAAARPSRTGHPRARGKASAR